MDRLIKHFDAKADDDLMLCEQRGVAYQRNMKRPRIAYDAKYYAHYRELDDSPIAARLNAERVALLQRYAQPGALVLDIGVGSGAFLRAALDAGFVPRGCDVNVEAVAYLTERGWLLRDDEVPAAVTFWDSLEHMADPEQGLDYVAQGAVVLVALPLVATLQTVRASKHYKPGEHLYYWTHDGFLSWMAMRGFRLLEESTHEVEAGREEIGAFAFRRDLPGYREHIAAYTEMHATRHYGSSATELHLELVKDVVRANQPKSILDFGCGRSDLLAHFYLDGQRRLARYDPAIPLFRDMPTERFDLVLCCDVMEHIPIDSVDKVLTQIKQLTDIAVFTISIKLARARLPDGSNAHCTILTRSEWEGWLRDVFGTITILPTRAPHEVNVLVGKRAVVSRPLHPCHCGGAVFLDSRNPRRKPVEWFVRCRRCGGSSEPCSTELQAEHQWSSTTVTRLASAG